MCADQVQHEATQLSSSCGWRSNTRWTSIERIYRWSAVLLSMCGHGRLQMLHKTQVWSCNFPISACRLTTSILFSKRCIAFFSQKEEHQKSIIGCVQDLRERWMKIWFKHILMHSLRLKTLFWLYYLKKKQDLKSIGKKTTQVCKMLMLSKHAIVLYTLNMLLCLFTLFFSYINRI